MGFPLSWSLCDEVVFDDPRFQVSTFHSFSDLGRIDRSKQGIISSATVRHRTLQEHEDESALWEDMEQLPLTAPLPKQLPELFYSRLGSLLRCGQYASRVEKFLQHFPTEHLMFIEFEGELINSAAIHLACPTACITGSSMGLRRIC